MKKALLVGLVLMALLLGCQEQQPQNAEATPLPTLEPTSAPTPTVVANREPLQLTIAPATPSPSPTPLPTPTPSPSPTPTPTPGPTPVSLVWVPDTQLFAYSYPEKFITLADWINAHRESENIQGVLHSGDLVDNGFKDWQWERFYPFLERLDPSLFFFPVSGNHDIGTEAQNFSVYIRQSFLNAYPEEQRYQGGKMLYRVFSVEDTDILLLGVGWELWKDKAALKWVDQVLAEHADMPCILVVHGFLLYETRYYTEVEQMIAQRPAIRLVLCGHMDGYYTRVFSYDDDQDGQAERQVTAMMLNMQRAKDYAFRLLIFDPVAHSIEVRTLKLDGSPASDMDGRGPVSFVIENAY